MDDAVAFWNDQLAALKTTLTLGPITACERIVPDDRLTRLSEGVLNAVPGGRLPPEMASIQGDVVVILSGADLISVGMPHAGGRRGGVVIVRRGDVPPLSLPNVARNVLAHELGHVLGLSHTTNAADLMCGRPAPCRPAVFQADTPRFFPLTDTERRELAKRYK